MTTPRKPSRDVSELSDQARRLRLRSAALMRLSDKSSRKPTHTAAMRKAFVRRFGWPTVENDIADMHEVHNWLWKAFRAGAAWQRRQRRFK